MRALLLAVCLTAAIGITAADAQKKTVNLRMTNGFDEPIVIYVEDIINNHVEAINRPITKGGEGTVKVGSDAQGLISVHFSVEIKIADRKYINYCQRVTTSADGKSELKYNLSKRTMKEGKICS